MHSALAFAGILALGFAWAMPLSGITVALGFAAALAFALLAGSSVKRPYLVAYTAGIPAHVIAFYWLFYTIRDFGGFENFPAFMVFTLFIVVSALQFPLYVLFLRRLPRALHEWLAAPAIAWIGAEFLSVRIFPWYLGHTQIAFLEFAQIADLAGAAAISFMMMWLAAGIVECLRRGENSRRALVPIVLFACSVAYGKFRLISFQKLAAPEVEVALVQANISIEEKHNIKMFRSNVERYLQMTQEIARPGLLIIWPESVIHEWIYAGLKSASSDPKGRVPYFPDSAILLGSLTFESEERFFNSAIGVRPGGEIAGVYHKQILMPFGEYTPFGDVLPFLRELNATVTDFTAGREIKIIELPVGGQTVRASPLICYEDLLPSLARESANRGANLLVNVTNDAWFGNSSAPLQHHLIAVFRSIETRRYLVRATNTGLTAIVKPTGETAKTIPGFADAVLHEKVQLLEGGTIFSEYLGETPWWVLAFFCLICLLTPRSFLRKR